MSLTANKPMTLIVATIRPEKLDGIKKVLQKRNIAEFSIYRASGEATQKTVHHGIPMRALYQKLRVEIVVENEFSAATVEEIVRVVNVGDPGDDKVFIISLDECRSSNGSYERTGADEKHLLLSRHAASAWSEQAFLPQQR
jgi:nitrogen regulatory protein PII